MRAKWNAGWIDGWTDGCMDGECDLRKGFNPYGLPVIRASPMHSKWRSNGWFTHVWLLTTSMCEDHCGGCPPIRARFQPVNPNAPFVHRLRGGRPAVVREQVADGRAHDDALAN